MREMHVQQKFANNCLLTDEVMEADVDLIGGPGATLVILHSIRAVEPLLEGVNDERESLIAYMAERIGEKWNVSRIVVMHKGEVIYSTDQELKKGDVTHANVKMIGRKDVFRIAAADLWEALKQLFRDLKN